MAQMKSLLIGSQAGGDGRPKTDPLQGENDCGLWKGNNQGSIFLAPLKMDAQNTERLHELRMVIVAS